MNVRTTNLKGSRGGRYISDTSAYTGVFDQITALSTSVVALVSSGQGAILGTLSAVTIPAGVTIYGEFTSVTPASGTMIVYNKC